MTFIDITKILWIAGMAIWILPPIRQYKGSFFFYFFILSLVDPVSAIYGIITKTNLPLWVFTLFTYLLILSVSSGAYRKKLKYIFLTMLIVFLTASPFLSKEITLIIFTVEHAVLFLIFLYMFIVKFNNGKEFPVFYIMLVIYELTNILKLFNLIMGFSEAYAFFIITTIAQIAFGLFFSIVRED